MPEWALALLPVLSPACIVLLPSLMPIISQCSILDFGPPSSDSPLLELDRQRAGDIVFCVEKTPYARGAFSAIFIASFEGHDGKWAS